MSIAAREAPEENVCFNQEAGVRQCSRLDLVKVQKSIVESASVWMVRAMSWQDRGRPSSENVPDIVEPIPLTELLNMAVVPAQKSSAGRPARKRACKKRARVSRVGCGNSAEF